MRAGALGHLRLYLRGGRERKQFFYAFISVLCVSVYSTTICFTTGARLLRADVYKEETSFGSAIHQQAQNP